MRSDPGSNRAEFDSGTSYHILQSFSLLLQFEIANLRIAQSRQKTYADRRCHELHFKMGDHVYLKVSSSKGTRHFQVIQV